MVSIAAPTIAPVRWRVSLFRALALLVGLVYLPGVLLLIAPWAPSQIARDLPKLSPLVVAWASATQPDSQRWAWGVSAVVDAAIAVVLLSLAWRPLGRPLLSQFLALALVVAVGANIAFVGPGIVVGYSPLLLVLLAYPQPRRLLTPFWRGPVDPWMLALAAVVGAFLLPDAWRALQAQVRGADELSLNFGGQAFSSTLPTSGSSRCLRPPGGPARTCWPFWLRAAFSTWAWRRLPSPTTPEAGAFGWSSRPHWLRWLCRDDPACTPARPPPATTEELDVTGART